MDPNFDACEHADFLMYVRIDEKFWYYEEKQKQKHHYVSRQKKQIFPDFYKIDGEIFDKNLFFFLFFDLHTSSELIH